MYKKKELQLSYFSICEGKKIDDKIVTYFALKAGSTVVENNGTRALILVVGIRNHNYSNRFYNQLGVQELLWLSIVSPSLL